MRSVVAVWDPRGQHARPKKLAAAAGLDAAAAGSSLGDVTIAGAAPPERFGSVSCVFAGQLHSLEQLGAGLGLPPDSPPGLVIAKGYAAHGVGFLSQLRGAYQLFVWDDTGRRLLVAPDHLLARSIFFSVHGSAVFIASELAPLLTVLPRRPSPDFDVIPHWITDRALPIGATLFRGVRRLPPGTALCLSESGLVAQEVWAPRFSEPAIVELGDAAAGLRAELSGAVRRRLTLDGTTGILLSGGLDSAMLAGTAVPILKQHGQSLPAYSAVFPGDPWDEGPDVALLARYHGLPSTRVRVRGGTLAAARRFQEQWCLPLPAPGTILDAPLMAQAQADGMRVMLDGQGGDELFTASFYLLTDLIVGGRWRQAYRLAHRFPGAPPRFRPGLTRALLLQYALRGAAPYAIHHRLARRRSDAYSSLTWMRPESRRAAETLADEWGWKRTAGGAPRWWAFLADLLVHAPQRAGMQEFLRRRGALAGIDSRQPLLTDVDLVELLLSVSPELAFSARYDRALARDAMRGIVPEPIRIPRRKSDYSELMIRTLAGSDFAQLRAVLGRPDAEIGSIVELAMMRDAALDHPPDPADPQAGIWSHHVWTLASTELWLRQQALGDAFPAWADALGLVAGQVDVIPNS